MARTRPGESPSSAAAGESKRVGAGAVASLPGLGLLVIVVIQNTQRVTIEFLFWSFTWPIWLFALAMAVLGALFWFGAGVMRRHRRRGERRD